MKNAVTLLLLLTFTFAEAANKVTDFHYFQQNKWIGKYYTEAINKDDLKTSFDIQINSLQDVSLIYVSDGETAERYQNLKAIPINAQKIKIIFNKKYKNMGIIYLEKLGNEYRLLGEPVYFINPGNESLKLKKLK
jgi:hypothetical protein